jgi:hypothetical protein
MRKRDVGIYFRVSGEEKEKLDEMLMTSDLTLSEFIRYTLFGFPKPQKMRISKSLDTAPL